MFISILGSDELSVNCHPAGVNFRKLSRVIVACCFVKNLKTKFSREYCKFGNLSVAFILQNFYFRIISEFLKSQVNVYVLHKVYSKSLLARTLILQGNQFPNISKNLILTNISGATACIKPEDQWSCKRSPEICCIYQ